MFPSEECGLARTAYLENQNALKGQPKLTWLCQQPQFAVDAFLAFFNRSSILPRVHVTYNGQPPKL